MTDQEELELLELEAEQAKHASAAAPAAPVEEKPTYNEGAQMVEKALFEPKQHPLPLKLLTSKDAQRTYAQALNTLSAGHYPEAKAAVLSALSPLTDETRDYTAIRDEEKRRLANDSMGQKVAGTVGGIGAGMMALPAKAVSTPLSWMKVASGAAKGAGVGAAMGFAQNPGSEDGKVEPLQIEKRLQNAASPWSWGTGMVAGGVAPVAEAGVNWLSEVQAMRKARQNPEEYLGMMRGKLNEAGDALETSRAAQREDLRSNVLGGRKIEIDPRNLVKGSDNAEEFLTKKYGIENAADQYMGTATPRRKWLPDVAQAEAIDIQDLKEIQDKLAKRPKGALFSEGEASKVRAEGDVANRARSLLEDLDPRVGEMNASMQRDIRLRDLLQKSAKSNNPSAILESPQISRQAALQEASRRSGVDLVDLSRRAQLAKKFDWAQMTRPQDLNAGNLLSIGALELPLRASPWLERSAAIQNSPIVAPAITSTWLRK